MSKIKCQVPGEKDKMTKHKCQSMISAHPTPGLLVIGILTFGIGILFAIWILTFGIGL